MVTTRRCDIDDDVDDDGTVIMVRTQQRLRGCVCDRISDDKNLHRNPNDPADDAIATLDDTNDAHQV